LTTELWTFFCGVAFGVAGILAIDVYREVVVIRRGGLGGYVDYLCASRFPVRDPRGVVAELVRRDSHRSQVYVGIVVIGVGGAFLVSILVEQYVTSGLQSKWLVFAVAASAAIGALTALQVAGIRRGRALAGAVRSSASDADGCRP